jgi:hypothetical protein
LPALEPRTRELYESQLRNHIEPYLGRKTLATITPQTIRNWRQQLLEEGRSATVAAKSYRLLRAVLNTAVKEDQLIAENPCRIPGYDKEVSPERPVGTIPHDLWASRRRKREIPRDFPVERVTRIELAWPAWKVAVSVCTSPTPGAKVCPRDAVNDRVSPCLMTR